MNGLCYLFDVDRNGRGVGAMLMRIKTLDKSAIGNSSDYHESNRTLSHDYAAMFLERITDIAYTTDATGNLTWVNCAIKEFTGFDPDDVIGHPFLPLFAEEYRASLKEAYERTLSGERAEGIAILISGKECLVSSLPDLDADGVVVGTFGLIRDITDRVEQERKYSSLLKAASDGIWILDGGDRFVDVNQAAADMLGYTKAEMLNLVVDDVDVNLDHAEIQARAELVKSGVGLHFDTRHRRKDGSTVDVDVSVSHIPASGNHLVVFVRDVSEAKRANEALLDAKYRFQQAFDTSPDAIVISRLSDGKYVEANQGFLDHMLFTRDEVIGKSSFELNIWVDTKDRERLAESLRKEGSCRNLEIRFRRKDGTESLGLISASIIQLDGEPHVITVTRDINDLRNTELERAKLQDQLQQAQKMDALGTLSSGIAHDFNNILLAIIGYAELSLSDLPDTSPVRENLTEITSAAKRAKNLVRQILTFSRSIEGDERALSISRIVQDAMAILNHTLPKMIDIELDLRDEVYPIKADQQQMEQVVINLVTNAADAIEESGRITVSTCNAEAVRDDEHRSTRGDAWNDMRRSRCKVCGRDLPGTYTMLSVKDDGMGISPEVRHKIFEPFFTTKAVGKGTGLGLSTVYGIINNVNGHICCSSDEGKGTEFVAYLPATSESIADKHIVQSDESPEEHPGGSILVVDDEKTVRNIAQKLLVRAGYSVSTATSGEEALARVEKDGDEIDVVVLDLSMPGMGGAACLREIRKINERIRVVIASGYIHDELSDELLSLGASGLIAKPYTMDELYKKMSEMIVDSGGAKKTGP